ncbi:tetratricopeptide repeat protein [Helicobacter kayseriensis]|uniref:tetratricopeptide repeat protein n=1 Tax=Helicobacter kayseriensis TaxID=2905877 RepID=UPI001E387408|nr:tetratricopeptide repeat protein [Helicobacter kayseriensis]MCE3046630.1 sel1 repeat family protein [Helicobacter kayseriensis]MCE3048068.1 sel1 repeat family protein [Helicobacter kayseriensis]
MKKVYKLWFLLMAFAIALESANPYLPSNKNSEFAKNNPYLEKKKKKSHITSTHGKPVPKYQLLPPITAKTPPPPTPKKPRKIIDEDGNIVEEKIEPPKPLTPQELELKDAQLRCYAEDGAWCWKVGMYFFEGKVVKQDYESAFDAFEAGCLKKNGGACYSMGYMYEFGRGDVPYDSKKALDLYLKSCNYGYNLGCEAYRRLR